jgi:hypothetical protein
MTDRTCSTCGAPATHVLDVADPSKGNLSCPDCLRFWPLTNARTLPVPTQETPRG